MTLLETSGKHYISSLHYIRFSLTVFHIVYFFLSWNWKVYFTPEVSELIAQLTKLFDSVIGQMLLAREISSRMEFLQFCAMQSFLFSKFMALLTQLHLNRKSITICSIKSFFFLSDIKFYFMKRLFFTALEETMSLARSESSEKKSAVVAGRVLNFGTKEGTTSFQPIERPITCVSALYDARQGS
jgi:hypothetical protein